MQQVTLFIPRILPNVNKKFIESYFLKKNIGICLDIKSKNRVNENGYPYWFAFITIQIFDTMIGRKFYNKVVEQEKTEVVEYYDHRAKNQKYWEISLRSTERKPLKEECKPLIKEYKPKATVVLEEGEILESNFGEREYLDMYNDYLQLEKEIYGSNCPYIL